MKSNYKFGTDATISIGIAATITITTTKHKQTIAKTLALVQKFIINFQHQFHYYIYTL
jgi:hypothetical protein